RKTKAKKGKITAVANLDSMPAISPERFQQLFPTLTASQIERVAAAGRRHKVTQGQVLIKQGDSAMPFFLVISGRIDIVQPSEQGEVTIVQHQAGEFTGELSMLTGRRSLVCARVGEPGEVVELDREGMQKLVQTNAELSDIIMRAFIMRRLE